MEFSETRIIAITVSFLLAVLLAKSENCSPKSFGQQNTVCVCNSSYCDYIGPIAKAGPQQILIYTSNKAGLRFDKEIGKFQKSNNALEKLVVNREYKYQTINGFGGAFTDATGINLMSLSNETRSHLLRSYFSEEGVQYNLCRVPIGGTDFSTHAYSYDDGDLDRTLKNFKLAQEDYEYKIPLIKLAQNLTGNKLKLFSSAWTAPRWMKTNNEYAGAGFLKQDMYQVWANYFIKFLDFYKDEGIEFWGITTGNEPSTGLLPFSTINSIGWTAPQMSTWIAENLGPTLRKSQHSSIQLMALDDQLFFLPWFISTIFENNATRKYVDGIALHWYWNNLFSPDKLVQTHEKFPEKFILGTEACKGDKIGDRGVKLGSWSRAEDYAVDIIQDLQRWVTGWVDWNMALDLHGGPTYINNNVDSPIIVNVESDEFYKQPMHYALGHFSKFVTRGSVRIDASCCAGKLQVVAFERQDNATVIVILNRNSEIVPVSLTDKLKGEFALNISAKSIISIIYW